MNRPIQLTALLVTVGVLGACGIERPVEPAGEQTSLRPVPPADTEPLGVFSLSPRDFTIDLGAELQLMIDIRNTRGYVLVTPRVSYSTSDPGVATVSSSGLVRGKSVGTTVISARATVGSVTYLTTATITVRQPEIFEGIVLRAQSGGWEPVVAHLVAGGNVQWRSGVIAVSGAAVTSIYLLDDKYGVVESLSLTDGVAAKTFATPGTYKYCSNACWDPPEFGTIVVH